MKLNTPTNASGGGHVIEDEGTPLTQRSNLNFTGAGVTVSDSGGKTVVSIPGGSGATIGTSTINFGSGAGNSYATLVVTGQTGITGTSYIQLWIQGSDSTTHHSAYEHTMLASSIKLTASDIVAGTGFTINAFTDLRLTGDVKVRWSWV